MSIPIWFEGDEWHVELSLDEAREIAEALFRATSLYPDCEELEVRFTEENGEVKWFVKAKSPRSDS